MRTIIKLLALSLLLVSCGAPSFTIKQLGDKFSKPDAPITIASDGNRISTKSSQGGIHIDSKGVYINPFVTEDRTTHKVLSVGFFISHSNSGYESGFNPIKKIIFITDKNERIEINAVPEKSEESLGTWNNITKEYNSSFYESASADISIKDFKTLASANWLETKIIGGDREQTYDKDEMSKSFLQNLKLFYKKIFSN